MTMEINYPVEKLKNISKKSNDHKLFLYVHDLLFRNVAEKKQLNYDPSEICCFCNSACLLWSVGDRDNSLLNNKNSFMNCFHDV